MRRRAQPSAARRRCSVADDPADVGRRPPDVVRLDARRPSGPSTRCGPGSRRACGRRASACAVVPDVARMNAGVLGRGVGRRAVTARSAARGTRPSRGRGLRWSGVASPRRRRTTTRSTSFGHRVERLVDDRLEVDVLALALGDVGRQDEPRAARARSDRPARRAPNPANTTQWMAPIRTVASIAMIASAAGRHVDREAVALARCPAPRSAGGDALDLGQQLRVA